MKQLLAAPCIVVLISLAIAAPSRAEEPSNSMVNTSWSLEKAGKTPLKRQSAQGAGGHAQSARRDPAKPHVFGGARVTNQVRHNQGKARAQVGVALPF